MDDRSNQFFNEFFSIYKSLASESKLLFGMAFFLKNLHSLYIEKLYQFLKYESSENKPKVLNLIELLGILITTKKDNANKIFATKIKVGDEDVTFSQVLNLILRDPLESSLMITLQKSETVV